MNQTNPFLPAPIPRVKNPLEIPPAPLFSQKVLKPGSFEEELKAIRKRMPKIFEEASSKARRGNLPLLGWGVAKDPVLHLDESVSAKPWYFIGDIHGDALALHTLLDHVGKDRDFCLCFLGDLVDRGPFSAECFALLLEFAMAYPNRVLWILGNHDESVRYLYSPDTLASLAFTASASKVVRKFATTVEPDEFTQWLNGNDKEREEIGRLFAEVCRALPRAALFADGLLATHGGVPLEDLWSDLEQKESLYRERALRDFTWVRLCDQPSKKGWKLDLTKRKGSSDFQMGFRDLENFQEKVKEWFPFRQIVRGHDHFEAGHAILENSKKIQVLTLTGFGFSSSAGNEKSTGYRSYLSLGFKTQEKNNLKVEKVPVDPLVWQRLTSPKEAENGFVDLILKKAP